MAQTECQTSRDLSCRIRDAASSCALRLERWLAVNPNDRERPRSTPKSANRFTGRQYVFSRRVSCSASQTPRCVLSIGHTCMSGDSRNRNPKSANPVCSVSLYAPLIFTAAAVLRAIKILKQKIKRLIRDKMDCRIK